MTIIENNYSFKLRRKVPVGNIFIKNLFKNYLGNHQRFFKVSIKIVLILKTFSFNTISCFTNEKKNHLHSHQTIAIKRTSRNAPNLTIRTSDALLGWPNAHYQRTSTGQVSSMSLL